MLAQLKLSFSKLQFRHNVKILSTNINITYLLCRHVIVYMAYYHKYCLCKIMQGLKKGLKKGLKHMVYEFVLKHKHKPKPFFKKSA